MLALFSRFLDLTLMRLPPQAFPASRFLFNVALATFLVSALAGNYLVSGDAGYAVARSALSAFDLCAVAAVMLAVMRRSPRWRQTATALLAGETVLAVFATPVLLAYAMEISNILVGVSQWLLIVWEVAFIAHVYRNALDTGMRAGLAIAFVYIFGSALLRQALIPFPEGAL